MCPDHEVLSAYFDNELDSVWNDQVSLHLSTCLKCREKVNSFNFIRSNLSLNVVPDIEAAKIRSWQGIQHSRDSIASGVFWKRRINMPLPLGAGILALFLLFSGASYLIFQGTVNSAAIQDSIAENTMDSVSQSNIGELIEFFENRDVSIEIYLNIPEDSGKLFIGDPQMLRAADYKRGKVID